MDGMNNYSLADIAAAANNENGFGGNNSWWIILFFLIIFGGNGAWGNGWNNRQNDFGQYATAASQNEILLGQKFESLDNKIDRGFTSIGNGISDATFALNNEMHNVQNVLGGAVVSEGRAIQTQLAQCCCENQRNTDALRYDMATMNAATKEAIHKEGELTRGLIQQNKIDTLQAKVTELQNQTSELKTQSMFCGIPRINPYGYGVYAYQPQFGGCGCGNNYMNI